MNKPITYNYSAKEIAERCRIVINLVEKDIEYFHKYGVNTSDIDRLADDIIKYEQYPDDKIFAEKVCDKTQLKNARENILRNLIKNMLLHIGIVSSKEEMRKNFKSQKITGVRPQQLIETAEKIYKYLVQNTTKVAESGLGQADIDDFKTRIKDLKNAMKDLETARQNRTKHTKERRELGCALYEKLVKYSTIGKSIWKGKNKENYQDYLLYSEQFAKAKSSREQKLLKNKMLVES